MKLKPLLKGLSTWIIKSTPQLGVEGTSSARYCYGIWLKHFGTAYKNGLHTPPNSVAELGPGSSLGTGIAALLTGVKQYYALDIIDYSNTNKNICILDKLLDLFKKREVADNGFTCEFLPDSLLEKTLHPDRIQQIRDQLINPNNTSEIQISYIAPWDKHLQKEPVDMIFSHACLEHVDDIKTTLQLLSKWLKTGGMMSHQIDFRSHGTAREWNGHWAYSDFSWRLIKGKQAYLINRLPYSAYIEMIESCGLKITYNYTVKDVSGIGRNSLAGRFKNMSDDDLLISGALIQAVKR
jgi:hypothetical protein